MKSIVVKILCGALTLLTVSCLFDAESIVGAEQPDNRYSTSAKLEYPTVPQIIDPTDFSLLVITDTHFGRYNGSVLAAESLRQTVPYDFLVINGDITQTGKEKDWEEAMSELSLLNVPYYFTLGNHDLYNDGQEMFYKYFGPTHYSLTVGALQLLFLDTGNGVIAEAEKEWYEEQLHASTASDIITFTHTSPITRYVQHMVAQPNPDEFYWMVDLHADYGVSALIAGHIHNNLEETFRGVRYISQTHANDPKEPQALHISYIDGELTYKRIFLPLDK